MKITIVYDNTSLKSNLQADWGFSCVVEAKDAPRILFDAGANGEILLSNMEKLGIDPVSIEEIFISHLHWDHIGGLNEFLKANPKVKKIYLPSSMGLEKEIVLKKPTKIHENIFSTGELEGIEQSMGVITNLSAKTLKRKGVVLIVGCSHPYMGTILDTARRFGKIYAVIGGMHSFSEFGLFKDIELICPTHCTQHKLELKRLYPEKFIEGGAGRVIEI